MRSIDEVRERLIQPFRHALVHPAMWGGSDSGVQLRFESELSLLCWIDQCEDRLRQARLICPTPDPLGVIGAIASQHYNWPDYSNEVASVYAQIVHTLGYWHPSRFLDAAEWGTLKAALNEEFFARDWNEGEVVGRFGPPSYSAGGLFSVVHGYAPLDDEPWIWFDFIRKSSPSNCEPWLANPLLRDVRIGKHTMTPLPVAIQNPIGRKTIVEDHWASVDPRLEDHADRENVDIVPVISAVRKRLPDVRVERNQRRHHCDIYAAWYFNWRVGGPEIELCSLWGFAPFLVTKPQRPPTSDVKGSARTREDAVEAVVRYLEPMRVSNYCQPARFT